MRYPEFLKSNGTIGFAAPSFGCAGEPYYSAFLNAIKKLEKLGYRTKLGPNCFASAGIGISNTPQACGEELTESYCDEDSDVLISCGGGEMMCEILNFVDFNRIAQAQPKWFMGYSDNTNFTLLNAVICDTASIYGPNAGAFGMEPWDESVKDALELLEGKKDTIHNYSLWQKESFKDKEHPLEPYNLTEKMVIRKYNADGGKVQFSGRLIGGCLDCMVNLTGTRFDHIRDFNERYAEDGIIWFMEACDLSVIGIRRAIWQMKNAGWFEHVRGFLIGRPYCFGEEVFGTDQYRSVTDLLAEYQVPVLMDLDIGHLPPDMPLITGGTADIICTGNDLKIRYTWK